MVDQRLFTYIEQELKRGVPNAAIKGALRDAGWPDEAVGQAFAAVQNRNVPPSPVMELPEEAVYSGKTKTKKIKTRGGRLPLLVIVGIVGVVASILAAVWYFIFIAPGQQKAVSDDTTPNILKSKDLDVEGATQSDGTSDGENATSTTSQGEAGELTVISTEQLLQSEPASSGNAAAGTSLDSGVAAMSSNDTKRKEDLDKMASAQKLWFGEHKAYYTCNLSGGDCGGKNYGFPEQIGIYLSNAGQDPMAGNYTGKKAVCGTDYVYCGLNNVPYSNFFCYYAKLESGGYYTVSQNGSAVRSSMPKVFEQCGVAE